jgi:hypothetical protein
MKRKIIIGPSIGKPPADWSAQKIAEVRAEQITRGLFAAGEFFKQREQAETLAARQSAGREERKRSAEGESARRRRKWLEKKREVARDRNWASKPERQQNGEADRRLAAWLTERGTPVSARTIANQRSREGWLDGG